MSDVAEMVGEHPAAVEPTAAPAARFQWTDGYIALLKEGIASHYSAGRVAELLSNLSGATITRSAVLGKASRLGIQFESDKSGWIPRTRSTYVPKQARAPRKPRQPRERVTQKRSKVSLPPEPLPETSLDDLAIPSEQRRQLMDLDAHCCRWPVGDPRDEGFFYCGAPEADIYAGRPYCKAHTWRATNHAGMARYRGMEA